MQDFVPVTSNKLYIQIYKQLYDAITEGRYKVGDKLPSEKELCQLFNVSRVPVREALCALELNGLVDSQQGVGVYVKELRPAGDSWMQQVEPQEIIRARMILEPDIARSAALHIDRESRRELEEILKRFQREADSDMDTSQVDREFHFCVAKASGSTLYSRILATIYEAMEGEMWELILSRTVNTRKYRDQNCQEHQQIGQDILDGRPEDAFRHMKAHMEKLYERFWS